MKTPPRLIARTVYASWASLGRAVLLVAVLGLTAPASAQTVRYLYDDLNRLIGVVDPQGNAAEYVYDAVGNILEIKRFTVDPSATVAITLMTPNQGPVGTTVQLFGLGFHSDPAQNSVTFSGGARAPVTGATATSLTTTVPPGATTGPITLTTPVGTATSPDRFTVLQAVAVSPAQADVALGGSLGFTASLSGTATSAVTWQVSGVVGGNAQLGTITPAGLYTAPTSPPPTQPLLIEAVLVSDPTQLATAIVRVVGQIAGALAAPPVTVGLAVPRSAQTLAGPLTVGLASSPSGQVMGGPLTASMAPVLTALSPSSGGGGTVLGLTIAGQNLQEASAVRLLRNGLTDPTVTGSGVVPAGDGTTVSVTLTISGSAAPGARVLQVLTPQGASTPFDQGTNIFMVTP